MSSLNRLSKASSNTESIRPRARTHIHILSFKMLSVKSDRLLFIIAALRNTLFQFIVSGFLRSTPHTRLNNQLIITLVHWHILSVLSKHDFFTNFVRAEVFFSEFASLPRVEVPLVEVGIALHLLFTDFVGYLFENLGFEVFGFEAYAGD